MPTPYVCDISHLDGYNAATGVDSIDFGQLRAAGVVGVVLKATQGTGFVDPTFAERVPRALGVFGAGCVGAYHFLDGSDPTTAMTFFCNTIKGLGLWAALDYEEHPASQCSLDQAVLSCQTLFGLTGSWSGMYGSDGDLLGAAIDAGHFGSCWQWLARYGANPPNHAWNLWQYSETGSLPGGGNGSLDLDTFNGAAADCVAWMQSLATV